MQKISVVALGCHKNTVESEYLLGILKNKGFAIVGDIESADIVIVHTCSFIDKAREESESCIRQILKLKKRKNIKVFVSGCLTQLLKDEILKLFPEIDGYVGTGELGKLAEIIGKMDEKKRHCDPSPDKLCLSTSPARGKVTKTLGDKFLAGGLNDSPFRVLSSGLPSAYLKIAEGCNHRCSFCIIPDLRGKYQSRTIKSLVDEAKVLVSSGIKELIIIAQDTTSFGIDLYNRFVLDKLLLQLSKIDGLKWIRLQYAYPSSITDNLIDVIKEYKNICNYIDIPVQHISQPILSAMKRPLNTRKIIEKINKKIPDVVLRTSFITGFPGETNKDIKDLIDFVKEGHFLYAGVFEYSNNEQAQSFAFKKQVNSDIAKKRRIEVENAQSEIFDFKINQMKNKEIEFLVENYQKKGNKYSIIARAEFQSPEIDGDVKVLSDKELKYGNFYKGTVTGNKGYSIMSVIPEGRSRESKQPTGSSRARVVFNYM